MAPDMSFLFYFETLVLFVFLKCSWTSSVRFEFQILKAISNESESTDRENYSLVVLPQKLEVPVPYIDQNIECIPSMVSMIIAKGFDRPILHQNVRLTVR